MKNLLARRLRVRKDFSKIKAIIEVPNLLEVQKRSYDAFLQTDVPAESRADAGLQGVFNSVFPIHDFKGQITLEVVGSGCTKPEDFRFEFSGNVLTVIRREPDACKAMPSKHAFTFPLREIGINPHAPFRISNAFIVNERLAK